MTRLNNDAKNGYVDADGFKGAPSSADNAAQRASTQPALFPNGAIPAAGTTFGPALQIVNATGSNSQSGATAVVPGIIMVVRATATTRAIRLSVAGTNARYEVYNSITTNFKVYPVTNGKIGTASTNVALSIAPNKGNIFEYRNGTVVARMN